MKTAITQLKEHINDMIHNGGDTDLLCVLGLIESRFSELERQQIKDAFRSGTEAEYGAWSENYYQDKYGN